MMKIPLIHIRDKQAFTKEEGVLRLLGNPVDIAKKIKREGYKLIHVVDEDALKGLSKNLDVYNALTFFINAQVECAPKTELIQKLLSLRCRVVLPPDADVSGLKEKNLLVARIPKGYKGLVKDFHDVILEEADVSTMKGLKEAGKRIIMFRKDFEDLDAENQKMAWGVIRPY